MKRKEGKLFLGILIAVLVLGIGYAAITGVNLLVNGSTSLKANGDFKVRFVKPLASETAIENPVANAIKISGHNADNSVMNVSEMNASIEDDTHATFGAGELDEVGEYVEFTYTVINESDGIDAILSFDINDVNDTEDYFEVTKSVSKEQIANNETATVTIKVKLVNTPKVEDVEGTFTVTLTATPVEASQSESGNESTETNTSLYSITGKAVSIGSTINPNEYQNTNESITGPYLKYTVDSNNQVVAIEGCKTGTSNADEVCIKAVDPNEYSNNKNILASYFGGNSDNIPSACSEESNYGAMEFTCANSYVVLAADSDGGIFINDIENGKNCVINPSFGIYQCK